MKSRNEVFEVVSYSNQYEGMTDKFVLLDKTSINLDNDIKSIADLFINHTYGLTWSNFINLVYSSYPIKISLKYTLLNLVDLAVEFEKDIR
ncbi:hypothetical protein FM120_36890 [Sphingobacterium faecium PCAi_F2.5]|nr:hypothetical protein FM120_36890 [Sphingobacterium faecium PCAi_F2.5]